MRGRKVVRLAAVLVVAAIILAGAGVAEGKPARGLPWLPPQPIESMLVEISDLLATPHQPTIADVQLEWSEIAGATHYNVYRSLSVRGNGFNFTSPHAVIPAGGSGKIVWADAGAYADNNSYAWVVRPVDAIGEYNITTNIAWKRMYTLRIGAGVAGADQNYISLPFRLNLTYGANVNNAAALIGDMRAYGSPINCVSSINRWNQSTGIWNTRNAFVGANFPLRAGEGCRAVVTAASVTYKIVGAYDPDFMYNLIIGTGPVAPDLNYISLPYHFNIVQGTWYNLSASLISNIRYTGAPINSASSVARWDQDLSYWQPRTAIGGTNYLLKPGECYKVVVTAPTVTWHCPVAIWRT